jgi:hypothetical protein
MREPNRFIPVLLVLLPILACSGGEKGDFTRLIRTDGPERYDLAVENIPTIRGAEQPLGAASNAPVIEGDRAVRKVHFITTYGAEVTPREIGVLVEEGLMKADFVTMGQIGSDEQEDRYTSKIEYTFPGGKGVLKLDLRARDNPRQLDFRYDLTEELE